MPTLRILLLLAVACSYAPADPAPVAALPAVQGINLDFEDGADARGMPLLWMGGARGYEIAADGEVVHGGAGSGRIAAKELEPGKNAAPLVQTISAEPFRGKRVRLSGWLRTRDVTSGWAGLWMRVDSAAKPNIAFDNMPDRGPRGTTEWKQYEVVLDVAEEASDVFFGVILAGNGTVWADDLALEEVPKSVPLTAVPKPAAQ